MRRGLLGWRPEGLALVNVRLWLVNTMPCDDARFAVAGIAEDTHRVPLRAGGSCSWRPACDALGVVFPSAELPRLNGVRALVVEDDPDLRDGVSVMLEMEGADVASAVSGNAGFSAFLRGRPDVIVSDLWMPDGNGFDFIEHVRKLSPEAGGLTPAIAVSAAENMRKALMAGFHVFLAKPFDPLHLVETIGEFFAPDRGQAVATWTISELGPGRLLVSLVGAIDTGDTRALTKALTVRLQAGPVDIVSDLRRLTRFSPSVASLAERELWSHRHQIRSVCVVGGSPAARIVSAAACKVLGIPVTFEDSIENGEHRGEA